MGYWILRNAATETEEINFYFYLLLINCRVFLGRPEHLSSDWGLFLRSSSPLNFWVAPSKSSGVREPPGRKERQRHSLRWEAILKPGACQKQANSGGLRGLGRVSVDTSHWPVTHLHSQCFHPVKTPLLYFCIILSCRFFYWILPLLPSPHPPLW